MSALSDAFAWAAFGAWKREDEAFELGMDDFPISPEERELLRKFREVKQELVTAKRCQYCGEPLAAKKKSRACPDCRDLLQRDPQEAQTMRSRTWRKG